VPSSISGIGSRKSGWRLQWDGRPGAFSYFLWDSSVLTFPIINDLCDPFCRWSIRAGCQLYALWHSRDRCWVCVVRYFIARKGGEAIFHRRRVQHGHAIATGGTKRLWECNGGLLPSADAVHSSCLPLRVFEMPRSGTYRRSRSLRFFATSESGTWRHDMVQAQLRIW